MEAFCSGFAGFWSGLQTVAWLEWAKTTFDLLKGIAWPFAAFGIVWIFRKQIRDRIPDLASFGPSGAVLNPPQQRISSQQLATLEVASHPLATVNMVVDIVRADLADFTPEAKEPRLIRALAEARVLTNFESVFGVIFGSQIEALKLLLEGPIAFSDAEKRFEEEVSPIATGGQDSLSFEAWSRFLLFTYLVELNGDQFSITQKGRDFAEWVATTKSGIPRGN